MSQYTDAILATPGLRGYWPGDSVDDLAELAGDAVFVGGGPVDFAGPALLSPITDAARPSSTFDGTARYLQVNYSAALAFASPGFTIEAWARLRSFNPTASEYRAANGRQNGFISRLGPSAPSAPRFQTYYYDATPTALPITSNGAPFTTPALDAVYHFAHAVTDNGDGTFTQRQYVNGILNVSGNRAGANASWSAAATPLQIGAWSGSRPWDGWLAHTAYYAAPLDGARMGHHYRLGAGLERRGGRERRFTFKAGVPAGIDGSVALPFGGLLDLGDAYAAGGIITADAEVTNRLRDLGIFDESAA